MPTYVSYQCSVCRRTQDIIRDDRRASINYCTITKGCLGHLFPAGEVPVPTRTKAIAGLDDWYKRGSEMPVVSEVKVAAPFPMSGSSRNAVTVAVFLSTSEKDAFVDNKIQLTFEQRRTENVAYQQSIFNVSTNGTTVISGRDSSGIVLRFDQTVINENRVFVRVNGVTRFAGVAADEVVLTPNTVTLNTPLVSGDVVTVLVYKEKNTEDKIMTFVLNDFYSHRDVITAWQNIRYLEPGIISTNVVGRRRWWIFTVESGSVQALTTSARMRLVSTSMNIPDAEFSTRIRFLLSNEPNESVDRIKNFVVNGQRISDEYLLSVDGVGTAKKMYVDVSAIDELYPPLQIMQAAIPPSDPVGPSYINPLLENSGVASSKIVVDANIAQTLDSKFVLGPV